MFDKFDATQSRIATMILAVVVGSHGASCIAKRYDREKVEKVLADAAERATGIKPAVTCPEDVTLEAGAVFQCEVKIGELVGAFEVTQIDDQGTISYELAESFISSKRTEDALVKLMDAKGFAVTASCGQRVHLSKPGTKFTCTVSDGKGEEAKIAVHVIDTRGNVLYKPVK